MNVLQQLQRQGLEPLELKTVMKRPTVLVRGTYRDIFDQLKTSGVKFSGVSAEQTTGGILCTRIYLGEPK